MDKLPIKLKKDPIIESIVEMRFTPVPGVHLSDLLPGMFFSKMRDSYPKLDNLQAAHIPSEIRRSDPSLRFKPTRRLGGTQFSLSVGDNVLSVSCARPYVGWNEFQPKISEAIEAIRETQLVQSVDRISVKYVNLVPEITGKGNLNALKSNVQIGNYDLSNFGCSIRTEIIKDEIINIVQIISDANVEIAANSETLSGLLLDIDCIFECKGKGLNFWDDYIEIIERVRKSEKEIFFSMLTDETLESFEPVWEE